LLKRELAGVPMALASCAERPIHRFNVVTFLTI
jgi:hypothetical protein